MLTNPRASNPRHVATPNQLETLMKTMLITTALALFAAPAFATETMTKWGCEWQQASNGNYFFRTDPSCPFYQALGYATLAQFHNGPKAETPDGEGEGPGDDDGEGPGDGGGDDNGPGTDPGDNGGPDKPGKPGKGKPGKGKGKGKGKGRN